MIANVSDTEFGESQCIICLDDINKEKCYVLTEKGLASILTCATAYGHSKKGSIKRRSHDLVIT
jgi:hypothetical protein